MEFAEAIKRLEQREQRVNELQARLAAVEKAEAEIARALNGASSKPASATPGRTRTDEILDAAYEILQSVDPCELPMRVGEICSRLQAMGVHVSGKSPSGNLSAKLGRDPRFRSSGRGGQGWTYVRVRAQPPADWRDGPKTENEEESGPE